jgi:hypothetical protein
MNIRNHLKLIFILWILLWSFAPANAQTEILTNATVIEMSNIGLDKEIILKKIGESKNNFDVSANALIELKKANVANEVIALMLEKAGSKSSETTVSAQPTTALPMYSESQPVNLYPTSSQNALAPKDVFNGARTIAIEKSSVNPSRQALEKELLKRKEWKQFNLSIVRYKESADLYMEIGFVHFSVITHRYVWRVYDRRSGIVVAAGETTSWGSLAKNIARDVAQKLNELATK